MAYARPTPFQPVTMFQLETDADQWALEQVHQLHKEVYSTMDTERSRQQEIGISEIGGECRKCVARKLSGQYEKPVDPSWKAQVGTAIHSMLEENFPRRYPWMYEFNMETQKHEVRPELIPTNAQPLYHLEKRLRVHKYKSLNLSGSCDVFVQGGDFGLVDDWKTQTLAKLKETAKGKISAAYRVQMPTYGLGYELLGFHVTHVVMYALPRDGNLDDAKPVLMRYDRQIALDAIAELEKLIDTAELLELMYPGEGWTRLVDNQESAGGCFDCPRYKTSENKSFFADMFAN